MSSELTKNSANLHVSVDKGKEKILQSFIPTFCSEFEIFPQPPSPESTGGWDIVQLLSIRLKSWLKS